MTPSAYTESLKALTKAGDAIENAEYNIKGGFVTKPQAFQKNHWQDSKDKRRLGYL